MGWALSAMEGRKPFWLETEYSSGCREILAIIVTVKVRMQQRRRNGGNVRLCGDNGY